MLTQPHPAVTGHADIRRNLDPTRVAHRWRKKSPVRRTPADAVRRAIQRQVLEVAWVADRPEYTQGMTNGAVRLMLTTAFHPYRLPDRGTVMRRSAVAKKFGRSERTITRWRAEARKAGRARLVAPPRSQDARGRWRNHGCYGTVLTPPQGASDCAVAILADGEPLPDDPDLFDPEPDLEEEPVAEPEVLTGGQTPRSCREDTFVPRSSLQRSGGGGKIAASPPTSQSTPGSSVSGPPDRAPTARRPYNRCELHGFPWADRCPACHPERRGGSS